MLVLLLPAALAGVTLGVLLGDLAVSAALSLEFAGLATSLVLLAAGRQLCRSRGSVTRALALVPILFVGMAAGTLRESAAALPTEPGTVAALATSRTAQIQISGTLLDDPRPREDRQQVVLEAVSADGRHVRGRLLAWLPRALDVATGDRVAFRAKLEEPHDFDGFAYRAFLARQGIGAIARTFKATVVTHAQAKLAAAAAHLRSILVDGLNTIVPEPEASLGAGILLGVRTSIDPGVSAAFSTAGLTHVVAISGWNIAIVVALVARMLDPLRRRAVGRLLVEPMTAAAVGGYVILVGSSPSVIRAALMAGALMLGRRAGSRAHAASALMLAAVGMLLVAPPVLWDVGFQLSLLATAGLIAFGAGIEQRMQGWPGWLREPVALTTAAQLATLPVVLANFERVSLVAPFANVVVVPLVPLVMLASAIASLVGVAGGVIQLPLISDAVSWFAAGSAWLGLRLMIVAGSAAAALPLAALPIQAPGWLALAWYSALGLFWHRARGRQSQKPPSTELVPLQPAARPSQARAALGAVMRMSSALLGAFSTPLRGFFAITAILVIITLATLPDGRLHLVVLDVGQGDGILVKTPTGRTMLVDAGPDPDRTLRQLGASLPWWQRTVDVMVLTHPHQDHVGGLPDVLRRFRVGWILDGGRSYPNPSYDRFLALTRIEPGSRYILARAGQRLDLDTRTVFEIWYPSTADAKAPLPADDINNASVVGLLRFGRFGALLTGDAEEPVEQLLESRSVPRRIDVLKVGHHGSHSSTSRQFVAALRPSVGLISVGAGNDYGHPAQVTLRTLRAAGVRVLRTDLDGAIEVQTDGVYWTVSTAGRIVGSGPSRSSEVAGPGDARGSGLRIPWRTPGTPTGSIVRWPFPTRRRLAASWTPDTFPRASSATRRGWRASRARRPGGWGRPGSRCTWASSRPPPSSTTSTSWRRGPERASTGLQAPRSWSRWGSANWGHRWRAIQ